MTEYKLPDTNATLAFGGTQWEPEWVSSEDAYTADQMQQAYAAGRESMRGECVKKFTRTYDESLLMRISEVVSTLEELK